jgi:DNA-binding NtrC family response regulator
MSPHARPTPSPYSSEPGGRSLRVLVLADRDADAEAMVAEVRRAGFSPDWLRVDTQAAYLATLDSQLDVILADYPLAHLDVLRALHQTRRLQRAVPMIIVSRTMSERQAVTLIETGAADYVPRDALGRLGWSVRSALESRSGKRSQPASTKHSA